MIIRERVTYFIQFIPEKLKKSVDDLTQFWEKLRLRQKDGFLI